MCELEDMAECALNTIVEMILQTPSKRVLGLLLSLSMSRNNTTRVFAVEKTMLIYNQVEAFKEHIERQSSEQMHLVNETKPPESLGDIWTENEVKICLALMLEIIPHKHGKFLHFH